MATVQRQRNNLRENNPGNDSPPVTRGRRKRGTEQDAHDRSIWVYLNDAELEIIEQASSIERRSRSSFVSDAALTKAEEILRIYNRTMSERRK